MKMNELSNSKQQQACERKCHDESVGHLASGFLQDTLGRATKAC